MCRAPREMNLGWSCAETVEPGGPDNEPPQMLSPGAGGAGFTCRSSFGWPCDSR